MLAFSADPASAWKLSRSCAWAFSSSAICCGRICCWWLSSAVARASSSRSVEPSVRLRSRSSRDRTSSLCTSPSRCVVWWKSACAALTVAWCVAIDSLSSRRNCARARTHAAKAPVAKPARSESRRTISITKRAAARPVPRRGEPGRTVTKRRSVTALANGWDARAISGAGRLRDCNAHPKSGRLLRSGRARPGGARPTRAIPCPAARPGLLDARRERVVKVSALAAHLDYNRPSPEVRR